MEVKEVHRQQVEPEEITVELMVQTMDMIEITKQVPAVAVVLDTTAAAEAAAVHKPIMVSIMEMMEAVVNLVKVEMVVMQHILANILDTIAEQVAAVEPDQAT